ncbi:MAG TPA: pyridoxamine 5'-phosphate oxidase family protein [Mycobacteriales bacterium]|nr:pyridoxamine 5'-phosphate oxidase family protein [Mycobacteriales bacterium]
MSTYTERAQAERIVAEQRYVVLATADRDGTPWPSPVYYAHRGLHEFVWISRPDTTHSRNIAERREISLVVFDSGQAPGTGAGVYARARAEATTDEEALRLFSRRCESDGLGSYQADGLRQSGFTLYRARTTEVSLLPGGGRPDRRIPI